MRSALALAVALGLTACGGSIDPEQATNAGYEALGNGDAEGAIDHFAQALGQLDAADPGYKRARMGEVEAKIELSPEAAAKSFLDFAETRPERVAAEDYLKVGSQLSARNAYSPAVDVLHAGIERFGDDAKLSEAMELTQLAVAESGDASVLSKLAGLGYANVGK